MEKIFQYLFVQPGYASQYEHAIRFSLRDKQDFAAINVWQKDPSDPNAPDFANLVSAFQKQDSPFNSIKGIRFRRSTEIHLLVHSERDYDALCNPVSEQKLRAVFGLSDRAVRMRDLYWVQLHHFAIDRDVLKECLACKPTPKSSTAIGKRRGPPEAPQNHVVFFNPDGPAKQRFENTSTAQDLPVPAAATTSPVVDLTSSFPAPQSTQADCDTRVIQDDIPGLAPRYLQLGFQSKGPRSKISPPKNSRGKDLQFEYSSLESSQLLSEPSSTQSSNQSDEPSSPQLSKSSFKLTSSLTSDSTSQLPGSQASSASPELARKRGRPSQFDLRYEKRVRPEGSLAAYFERQRALLLVKHNATNTTNTEAPLEETSTCEVSVESHNISEDIEVSQGVEEALSDTDEELSVELVSG